MKAPFKLILIVVACVLFLLGGLGDIFYRPAAPAPWPWSGRLIAWGLFCWCLSTIVTD